LDEQEYKCTRHGMKYKELGADHWIIYPEFIVYQERPEPQQSETILEASPAD